MISIGKATTVITRKAYLKYDTNLGMETFGVEILCSSSCRKPNGHIQPQGILPIKLPTNPSVPMTYKPDWYCAAAMDDLSDAKKFCNEPIGHAPTANGHE